MESVVLQTGPGVQMMHISSAARSVWTVRAAPKCCVRAAPKCCVRTSALTAHVHASFKALAQGQEKTNHFMLFIHLANTSKATVQMHIFISMFTPVE